jgi:hypothetical protein
MAGVLFAGQGVGLLVLPLMLFHQIQLMVCAWLAGRYARHAEARAAAAAAVVTGTGTGTAAVEVAEDRGRQGCASVA